MEDGWRSPRGMELGDFLKRSLVVEKPWFSEGAAIIEEAKTVEIRVAYDSNEGLCPKCGRTGKRHDSWQNGTRSVRATRRMATSEALA